MLKVVKETMFQQNLEDTQENGAQEKGYGYIVGERMREIRKAKGLSQKEIADRTYLLAQSSGVEQVSRPHITNIEKGKVKDITLGSAIALANALEVDPEELGIIFRKGSRVVPEGTRVLYVPENIPGDVYYGLQKIVQMLSYGAAVEAEGQKAMNQIMQEQIREANKSIRPPKL